MFNKKKKQQPENNPSVSMPPNFSYDDIEAEKAQIQDKLDRLNMQSQQVQSNQYQNPLALPQQPIQQQMQQVQQPMLQPQIQQLPNQKVSRIVEIKELEGDYYLISVLTDYPLRLGQCKLDQ